MLKMLNKSNSFGWFMRTSSGKVTAFLANETTVRFFLSVLRNIFLFEIPERLFGGGFSVEVFLKMFFLLGRTNTLLFIFALDLEMRLFTSFREWFLVFHEIFEEFFFAHRSYQEIAWPFGKFCPERYQLCLGWWL